MPSLTQSYSSIQAMFDSGAWRSSLRLLWPWRADQPSLVYDCWSSSVSSHSVDCFKISIRLQFLLIWGHMRVRPTLETNPWKSALKWISFHGIHSSENDYQLSYEMDLPNYVSAPVRIKGRWTHPIASKIKNKIIDIFLSPLKSKEEMMTGKEMIWRMD